MLQLSAQRSEEMVVLRCTGRMVAGEGLQSFHRTAIAQRSSFLVVDLVGVEVVDAAGLGTLLRVREWCEAQGTKLKLINAGKRVREVLAVTALDSILDVRPAETDADVRSLVWEWACAET